MSENCRVFMTHTV